MNNSNPQVCQSCAMPLTKDEDFGTNLDGSKNEVYCFHCFGGGNFLDDGITLEEKIDKNVKLAVKMGWDEAKARKMAEELLPKLGRWQKK